jgi:hypothetical protein
MSPDPSDVETTPEASTAVTVPPPPPPDVVAALGHGESVRVPRRLVVAGIVFFVLVLAGASFAAGFVARGPGDGVRVPKAVPTSCAARDVLGVMRDWNDAYDAYNATDFDTPAGDQAFSEFDAQETRLKATLAKCS